MRALTGKRNTSGLRLPWKPGQSGNPRGRPSGARGLARYIREHTDDGRKLADFLLRVVDCEDGKVGDCKITMDHKLEAVRILLNRGFGRPVEQIAVDGGASLSDLILAAYRRRESRESQIIKDVNATIADEPRPAKAERVRKRSLKA